MSTANTATGSSLGSWFQGRKYTGAKAVFRREFRSYFASPLGYIFIVIFLVASGYLTLSRDFGRFLELRQADLDAFFTYIPWLFVVLVPAVAMRLWAEERKTGSVELLLTLPVTLEGSYVGKFLAGWCFLGFSLLLTWPVVFQVARLGDPDWGVIFTGYLACLLTSAAFLAIGMLFSALTKNQVVAFILGVTACVIFLLLGLPQSLEAIGNLAGGWVEEVASSVSLVDHFESLTRGLLELPTLLFFLLFTAAWLVGGMLVLRQTKAN
ncbi:MAG: ABC transporter permease [Deltaproteobacteria bacterium]|nr:ABC transporter permease [Deltaproteobacteria bacterium]